jgi:uncharacterized protein (TIGR02722 family)
MNAMKATVLAVVGAAMLAAASGCGTRNYDITRVDPNTVIDVDYRFTGDDAREVYRAMVDDALYRRWIDEWMQSHAGAKPIVVIGPMKNDTDDYIDTEDFTVEWERELLNSGRVRFVAMAPQRDPIRQERAQGQEWNTPETRKQMRAELGADLIMIGRIGGGQQRSRDGRTMVKEYKVTLELINLETNEKVWIGSHDIKKLVRS